MIQPFNLSTLTAGADPCEGSRILARNRCKCCDLPILPMDARASFVHIPHVLFHSDCVVLFGADHCKAIAEATL
jgi:hypothetical protein